MIDVYEAAKMIKNLKSEEKILNCLEFKDFFLFMMAPKEWPKNKPYRTGTVFDAIDKNSGKWFDYDITKNVDDYFDAITHKDVVD